MEYDRINWGLNTPINANNLNKMDEQIYKNTEALYKDITDIAFTMMPEDSGGNPKHFVKMSMLANHVIILEIKLANPVGYNPIIGNIKDDYKPLRVIAEGRTPISTAATKPLKWIISNQITIVDYDASSEGQTAEFIWVI